MEREFGPLSPDYFLFNHEVANEDDLQRSVEGRTNLFIEGSCFNFDFLLSRKFEVNRALLLRVDFFHDASIMEVLKFKSPQVIVAKKCP